MNFSKMTLTAFALSLGRTSGFVARQGAFTTGRTAVRSASTFSRTLTMKAEEGQAEVILVGCGAPNRGMGWYHAIQMLEKK
eukprot:scaffold567400_cov59-Attheya_sp.AAC.2